MSEPASTLSGFSHVRESPLLRCRQQDMPKIMQLAQLIKASENHQSRETSANNDDDGSFEEGSVLQPRPRMINSRGRSRAVDLTDLRHCVMLQSRLKEQE